MKAYAGIGSRSTPENECGVMIDLAGTLAEVGYTLRTGGAKGADEAFLMGAALRAGGAWSLWLPWQGYNGHEGTLPTAKAFEVARRFHPAWHMCGPGAQKMHARNANIVLGADLATPVEFVVCWTPRGEPVGGTGQALRIAAAYDIPVYNLATMTLINIAKAINVR